MKIWSKFFVGIILLYAATGCHSTKSLQTAISKKDTPVVKIPLILKDSSFNIIPAVEVLNALNKNKIDFKTFSSKAKIQYQDHNGKQPDFNAFIRLQKDSVLWISISATFLGIEAFRLYITPDTLIILNKLDKSVEYHSFRYIESFAHIPMDFTLLQNILIGNPVYVGNSIVSYRQTENHILIGTVGSFFKNLITLSSKENHLERIKLDDIDLSQNRTASLVYGNYERNDGFDFATDREINVSEKSKVDVSIEFKQYEFNKDLSFPFAIPRNFKIK
jgi:outer membrane lipoprotein-sorting protein